MKRAVLDPVAKRHHAPHPQALLLRGGDLIADLRVREIIDNGVDLGFDVHIEPMRTALPCRLDPRADVRAPKHLHVEAVCVARDGDARRLPQLFVQLREPDKRWTNLRDNHEVYDAGRTADGRMGGGSLPSASAISCWPGLPRFCPVSVPDVAAIWSI